MPLLPPGDSGGEHDDGDGLDDEFEFRPPLPPEDRIWRHPSEVAAASARPPTLSVEDRSARGTAVLVVAVSALIGATLTVGLIAAFGGFDERTRIVERQVAIQPVTSADADDSVAALTARTAPSVAGVYVTRGDVRIVGSAVAVRSDGYLLTTASLVADADEIEIRLEDDGVAPARVVGHDDATGVAVLHVDGATLTPAAVGTADRLDVGDELVAVTHLDGGRWSAGVERVVVSALDRRLRADDGAVHHGMILFDAPLAVGAAGGPIVDRSGAVVAIAGAVPAAGDDDEAYGVATPIDIAIHACDQLIEFGRVRHVWLGVEGLDLAADAASALGIEGGAAIQDVLDGSPAASAGLAEGDVIVGVDGEPVASMSELIARLRTSEPGDEVVLEVRRGEESMETRAVLTEKTAA